MLYAGLDLSRKRIDFHLLDAEGATVDVGASPPDADGLRGLSERLDHHGAPIRAAIESMNSARFVHDRLELAGWQVEIADAQKVKGTVALAAGVGIRETPAMRSRCHLRPRPAPRSAFARYRFPPEVITLAVRWYLRFGLSYRDVEELLAERGIQVDHVTVYRWVQRFAPEFAEAARARQHVIGDRWHVDETYLKVGGTWRYLFRAIDQFGQVIDIFLSPQRDAGAARRFFGRAIGRTRISSVEVTTDRYWIYPRVLDEMLPAAFHDTKVHANNALETDHGRLKARLRPMRGLKRDRPVRVIVAGHAFVQNLRRGFYDPGTDVRPPLHLAEAFAELALVI